MSSCRTVTHVARHNTTESAAPGVHIVHTLFAPFEAPPSELTQPFEAKRFPCQEPSVAPPRVTVLPGAQQLPPRDGEQGTELVCPDGLPLLLALGPVSFHQVADPRQMARWKAIPYGD